jgi:hypothetical protein
LSAAHSTHALLRRLTGPFEGRRNYHTDIRGIPDLAFEDCFDHFTNL